MDKLFQEWRNIDASLAALLLFSHSMFYVRNPCKRWQIKINKDSSHFSRGQINIVASFAEHLEHWKYKRFTRVWVIRDKVKSTIKSQDTLHIEKTKYRVIHKKKNIDASFAEHAKFKSKQVLNMEFGQLVSNENQQARFKTFSTMKMVYTRWSMKGAILLPFQWSTKSFQKEELFHPECE